MRDGVVLNSQDRQIVVREGVAYYDLAPEVVKEATPLQA
jgi:hypothetical protein